MDRTDTSVSHPEPVLGVRVQDRVDTGRYCGQDRHVSQSPGTRAGCTSPGPGGYWPVLWTGQTRQSVTRNPCWMYESRTGWILAGTVDRTDTSVSHPEPVLGVPVQDRVDTGRYCGQDRHVSQSPGTRAGCTSPGPGGYWPALRTGQTRQSVTRNPCWVYESRTGWILAGTVDRTDTSVSHPEPVLGVRVQDRVDTGRYCGQDRHVSQSPGTRAGCTSPGPGGYWPVLWTGQTRQSVTRNPCWVYESRTGWILAGTVDRTDTSVSHPEPVLGVRVQDRVDTGRYCGQDRHVNQSPGTRAGCTSPGPGGYWPVLWTGQTRQSVTRNPCWVYESRTGWILAGTVDRTDTSVSHPEPVLGVRVQDRVDTGRYCGQDRHVSQSPGTRAGCTSPGPGGYWPALWTGQRRQSVTRNPCWVYESRTGWILAGTVDRTDTPVSHPEPVLGVRVQDRVDTGRYCGQDRHASQSPRNPCWMYESRTGWILAGTVDRTDTSVSHPEPVLGVRVQDRVDTGRYCGQDRHVSQSSGTRAGCTSPGPGGYWPALWTGQTRQSVTRNPCWVYESRTGWILAGTVDRTDTSVSHPEPVLGVRVQDRVDTGRYCGQDRHVSQSPGTRAGCTSPGPGGYWPVLWTGQTRQSVTRNPCWVYESRTGWILAGTVDRTDTSVSHPEPVLGVRVQDRVDTGRYCGQDRHVSQSPGTRAGCTSPGPGGYWPVLWTGQTRQSVTRNPCWVYQSRSGWILAGTVDRTDSSDILSRPGWAGQLRN